MRNPMPFVKTLDGRRKFERIFGNSDKKKGLSSGLVALKKGDTVGIHNTKKKEEIVVVLDGKARVNVADKHFILENGMMLYIPPKTLHNVKNIGARLLKYLYITAAV